MEHTEHQAALIEQAGSAVAEGFKPFLREIERENDRIMGELRTVQRHVQTVERERDTAIRKVKLLEQERPYTNRQLPAYVDVPTDPGSPASIVLDLHGSLTPDRGFPIVSGPWPGVKECLEEWAGRGVILLVATAALSPDHPQNIIDARERLTWEFINRYGLPIRYVTGKVGAHIFYDDRMVPVVPGKNPWDDVYKGVIQQLGKRAKLDKQGNWVLVDLKEIGKEITKFPDEEQQWDLKDRPRGYSTPVFDVDIHRCLLKSNSSEQDSELRPGAKEVVNAIYDAGYTVHASCAGWDPATHQWDTSNERVAGLQRTLKRNGVKYDEIVAKLHGTVFVDDKGIAHTGDWSADKEYLIKRLESPAPEDEVTEGIENDDDGIEPAIPQ